MNKVVPGYLQPWYAYDATTGGNFDEIEKLFSLLLQCGPE